MQWENGYVSGRIRRKNSGESEFDLYFYCDKWIDQMISIRSEQDQLVQIMENHIHDREQIITYENDFTVS